MSAEPRRCGVLGSPIVHSLSPAMHRAAYRELGIDWTYEPHEVSEAGLPQFVRDLDDRWRGLSVTAPLKRCLVPLVDDVSEDVDFLGVANTVVFADDRRSTAFNTDVPGAVAAVREAGVETVGSGRILGGGATAASFVLALSRLGLRHVELVVRDVARAAEAVAVADRLGVRVTTTSFADVGLAEVDVFVSTVPVVAVDPQWSRSAGVVFDAIYDPWPTPLAAEASTAGIVVVSGLDLLAHQAALQVHLMTGGTVTASLLRDAALAELASRRPLTFER